jgi:hypothetical protein
MGDAAGDLDKLEEFARCFSERSRICPVMPEA